MTRISDEMREEIRQEIAENIKLYSEAGDTKGVSRFERQLVVIGNIEKYDTDELRKYFPRIDYNDYEEWSIIIRGIAGGWYLAGCGRRDLPIEFIN